MTPRPHILFVDDEPRILGGMRRMLRTYRDRWDMSFAEGGEAALVALRDRPCDVIISDYRMPGMNGAQLLEHVRSEFPATARVILSGQTTRTTCSASWCWRTSSSPSRVLRNSWSPP
jgi:YesN/AraC family two-component response regulator